MPSSCAQSQSPTPLAVEVDAKIVPCGFERATNWTAARVGDLLLYANQRGLLILAPTLAE